jgi:hypothetical protein
MVRLPIRSPRDAQVVGRAKVARPNLALAESSIAHLAAARLNAHGYGRVPRLLVPSAVGVAGKPATIGVMTGVAAPTNSLT